MAQQVNNQVIGDALAYVLNKDRKHPITLDVRTTIDQNFRHFYMWNPGAGFSQNTSVQTQVETKLFITFRVDRIHELMEYSVLNDIDHRIQALIYECGGHYIGRNMHRTVEYNAVIVDIEVRINDLDSFLSKMDSYGRKKFDADFLELLENKLTE